MSTDRTFADRREFLKKAGLGVVAAGTLLEHDAFAQGASVMRELTEGEKLSRIASSCWPPRQCFKSIGNRPPNEETVAMRKKYGEITMLDFPQWTRDTYPGVYHLDLWSDVFGDPGDPTQYNETKVEQGRPDLQRVPLGPDLAVIEEVAREAGGHHPEDEHRLPARLEQRPPEPGGSRRGEAQGRHPRGQGLDGRRGVAGHQDDARQHRRVGDADHARGERARDRLPEERQDRRLHEEVHRVVQGARGLRARRSA